MKHHLFQRFDNSARGLVRSRLHERAHAIRHGRPLLCTYRQDSLRTRQQQETAADHSRARTDAIAAWFLRTAKSSPEAILSFESMLQGNEREALGTFVKEARVDGALRNDDVAIVYVRISG